jgi:hypothetical protein
MLQTSSGPSLPNTNSIPLVSLGVDRETHNLVFQASWWLLLAAIVVGLAWYSLFRWWRGRRFGTWELDEAEIGIGSGKLKLKPNYVDRQIAYSIWVELSTRKIGLEIDPEDDVIAEIYDSWYAFFSVTRDLIKDVPVSKVRGQSTSKIINLSIEVLNEGLRPHLTKWQARFRHWYDRKMDTDRDVSPQELQKKFPEYENLIDDLMKVNRRLINYRLKMIELVRGS